MAQQSIILKMESDRCSENQEQVHVLETFDQLCDICKEDREVRAVGYCQQCSQYLCKLCCDHHGKIIGTKHHKVAGKDATNVFGRDTLFGRKLMPSSVFVAPALPSKETTTTPKIKYINFFRDIDKMIVISWYPSTYFYAISEVKGDNQERYSIGLITDNASAICLDMENTQILVVGPNDNTISEVDISQPLFSDKEVFKTSGECRALVEFDNGFAVAIKMPTNYSIPEWQIQYLTRDGRIKNRISYDEDGNAQFKNPQALASNNTQNILYVLDDNTKKLMGFNIAGEILFSFTHADMTNPRSLAVDLEGNIYVACSDKVLQVNKDGSEHVIAIKNKQSNTNLVAFNSAKELLVVGDGSDKLQCFTFA